LKRPRGAAAAAVLIAGSTLAALALAAFVGPMLVRSDGIAQDRRAPYAPPGAAHWLGTDGFGRDELARLLRGARVSLTAGVAATAIALACGALTGAAAGYYGGWGDDLIVGTAELFQSLPWFYLVLAVRALLPLELPPAAALAAIAIISGLTAWPRPSRLIRGIVLAERERDYVVAARAFGAGDFYLLRRHILPSVASVVLVQAVLLIPQFILAEVTLSFLGLGIGAPAPSLGNMLANLRDLHVLTSYPWMLAPAVLLIAVTSSCQILADKLRSLYDSIH
jgi:peptide/nickel transport system permease protein